MTIWRTVKRPWCQVITTLVLLLFYSLLYIDALSIRSIATNPRKLLPRTNIVEPFKDSSSVATQTTTDQNNNDNLSHIIFPGGGIFFYWQAGVINYLREQKYDLSSKHVTFCGASAGALTATLTAYQVDFVHATELALQLAHKAQVWDRPLGLQGVWGPMIYDWLQELIPQDEGDDGRTFVSHLDNHRLSLLITTFPSLRKERVSQFHNREDLIECNMASIHLPIFLDGRWTRKFRHRRYIDGSFLSKNNHYLPPESSLNMAQQLNEHLVERTANTNTISLDYWNPALGATSKREHGRFDFVKAVSPKGIWSLLDQGMKDARVMEEQGKFNALSKQHNN